MSEQHGSRTGTYPLLTLEVGPMAHGGHCIARHEGRVVFVRHAIPGETVQVALTERAAEAKYWRGDVVEVLNASDYRRRHIWKLADSVRAHGSGRLPVGGAEYGHITDQHQRRLKAHVFRDTLQRIGGISIADLPAQTHHADGEIHVEDVSLPHSIGLHWRTRVSFAVDAAGSLAMKPFRSNELIELRGMPLAVEAIHESRIFAGDFRGAERVDVVAPSGRDPITLIVHVRDPGQHGAPGQGRTDDPWEPLRGRLRALCAEDAHIGSVLLARHAGDGSPAANGRPGRRGAQDRSRAGARGSGARAARSPQVDGGSESVVHEVVVGERRVSERLFGAQEIAQRVDLRPEGFWQIHRNAPEALVRTVGELSTLGPGGRAADLYAGAGLFTAWAAARAGGGGAVLSVEGAEASSRSAAELFADVPQVEVVNSSVERSLARLRGHRTVVLDPPRAGAGAQVVAGLDRAGAEEIVYVSCEPSSFARDAKDLLSRGFVISGLRVLDLYPNTHHMESVARFTR